MTLSSKERAELRAEAHHLTPAVHVGHQGLTDALLHSLDDALRTRELVKVALAKATDMSAKEAAHQLAEKLGADVVQTIGRTCTLFRENPELERKKGAPAPWRT
jgi:RNA-binding protein